MYMCMHVLVRIHFMYICCINSSIPCVCLCVRLCVSVWVSVNSNFSGTGGRSAMSLSPTWRDSPGELHQLRLELTRRVAWEEKPLELFTVNAWNHTLHITTLQYFRKLVVFLKKVEQFMPSPGTQTVEERLSCVGSFVKAAWVEAVAFGEVSTGFEERAEGGYLTAVRHTKVTAVRLVTYTCNYKLTGENLELFIFRRDAAK